jgi:hypothetical protein
MYNVMTVSPFLQQTKNFFSNTGQFTTDGEKPSLRHQKAKGYSEAKPFFIDWPCFPQTASDDRRQKQKIMCRPFAF